MSVQQSSVATDQNRSDRTLAARVRAACHQGGGDRKRNEVARRRRAARLRPPGPRSDPIEPSEATARSRLIHSSRQRHVKPAPREGKPAGRAGKLGQNPAVQLSPPQVDVDNCQSESLWAATTQQEAVKPSNPALSVFI
ncbi:unnamed protein product [Arctogadus glacialis]